MRLIAIIATAASLYAQVPAADVAYDLTTPAGVISGKLRMPSVRGKVPAVLIVARPGSDEVTLADALASKGIASVRYGGRAADGVTDSSLWIAKMRNDARFKSVVVADRGEGAQAGVLAAREARADGFVSIGGTQGPLHAMLNRPKLFLTATEAPAVADAIAAYMNDLDLPQHPTGERRSPRTVTSATIDGSRIAVEYGQLGVRDRAIWGAIVPWNKIWVPGADETTTLTTNAPIVVGPPGASVTVPTGDHTLYAMPADDEFVLIINKQTYQYHTVYQAAQDLGRVKMTMTKLDQPVELLRFEIVKTATGGTLKFAWADREYSVPFLIKVGS